MAARTYLHITANGDVEPCVFAHFATHNLHEVSLTEALEAPLFDEIRKAAPYEGNQLRPCMLIDQPYVSREIFGKTQARPTHPGANSLTNEMAPALDRYADAYRAIADPPWRAGDWMRLWPDPPDADAHTRERIG
jgi:hypothetical protein